MTLYPLCCKLIFDGPCRKYQLIKVVAMEENQEILKYCEFETKYRTEENQRYPFKKIMQDDLGLVGPKFLYVQSGDEYLTLDLDKRINKFIDSKADIQSGYHEIIKDLIKGFIEEELGMPKFLRHRASDDKKTKQNEITFKKKHKSSNNIRRTEINLRVDNSDAGTIREFCEGIGYKYKFDVSKFWDIYYADDAVLVFYSVKDDHGKMGHFIEIEVNEEMDFTEDEAWTIIKKYEKILEPVGVKASKRIRKSLFEMYNPK